MKLLLSLMSHGHWSAQDELLVFKRTGKLTSTRMYRTMSVRSPQTSQLPSLHYSGSREAKSLGSAKGFLHRGFQNVLASAAEELLLEVKESITLPVDCDTWNL